MLVQERNALVTEQRRLSTLINNLANQRGQFQELKQQFNGEVARLRESYMQAISDLRKSVDEIMAKYAELNGKEEVAKALKDLSSIIEEQAEAWPIERAHKRHQVAGEDSRVRFIRETVELHREKGVDHVDVMLNGKGPVRMVFDTGAGPTTLSAELASRLGLKPTGRTVPCVVADGTKVMAKEMIIRTVSVGRLTVKDVTCVVMPKDKGDVDPLARTELPRALRLQVHPGIRPPRPDQGRAGRTGRESGEGQWDQEEALRSVTTFRIDRSMRFLGCGRAGVSGPGWPRSSAASAQNWRSSTFFESFSWVHATAWSNHLRASYLSPFCQRAMATKNQSWALPPFCRAIEFTQSVIDSVQCPERYSTSASVFR